MTTDFWLKLSDLIFKVIEGLLKIFGIDITINPKTFIHILSDSGYCYFQVPGDPENKYPQNDTPSYSYQRIVLPINSKLPITIFRIDGYIYNPRGKHWTNLVKCSNMSIRYESTRQDIFSFSQRTPEFQTTKITDPTELVIPFCNQIFGSSLSELYKDELALTVLVLHINTKYLAIACKLPSVNLPNQGAYFITYKVFSNLDNDIIKIWATENLDNSKKRHEIKLRYL